MNTYRGAISWEGIWGSMLTYNGQSGVSSSRCAEVRTRLLCSMGKKTSMNLVSPDYVKIDKFEYTLLSCV